MVHCAIRAVYKDMNTLPYHVSCLNLASCKDLIIEILRPWEVPFYKNRTVIHSNLRACRLTTLRAADC